MIDPPLITARTLAKAYGEAKTPLIRLGSGLSRYINGGMNNRLICILPALVGAYGKKGGGCYGNTSTGHLFDMSVIERPDFVREPTRVFNMNRLGEALNDLDDPPVKSLYVYHSNPASIAPDQNAIIRGLEREDLFTVVHERFMTDTARYADIVLPASSSLEQGDLFKSYGTYYLQRSRPVIPPVGESKSNWEAFSALADALGWDEPFFRQSADEVIDDLLNKSPVRDVVNLDALNRGEPVMMPAGNPGPPFGTISGKVEIENFDLDEPLPRYLPASTGDYPLRLVTAPARDILNSSFCEQEDVRAREGGMRLQLNPVDAGERELTPGQIVVAANDLGEVDFILAVSDKVPAGVAVAEGAWWIEAAPGERTVNALTSQKLTDMGRGSTLYDNFVEVTKK
jgi:anaerobic selenocysteine-containing dehydrogenase